MQEQRDFYARFAGEEKEMKRYYTMLARALAILLFQA